MMTAEEYRKLFLLRTKGELDDMECTKSLFNILKPIYSKGMCILDVPCGTGHYFRKLKELGEMRYVGIDLDSEAITMAKEYWKTKNFYTMDSENMQFFDNSFDAVICYNLILHLKDYRKTIRELFRVSKKYIIIRSLFADKKDSRTFKVEEDYLDVYKSGFIYYNTHSREEITKFIKSLGKCKIRFISDNIEIPKETVEKQIKSTGSNAKHFTVSDNGKQKWNGLNLNYCVLLVEKE